MTKQRFPLIGLAVLLLVALVYWPISQGGFVWDDEIDFLKYNWLTEGDQWKHYVFRDFHGWTEYFRPLVVAMFTLQLRLFDISPGPMHVVSLGLHLVNIALVGLIATRVGVAAGKASSEAGILAIASMLIFGLHPLQIEPVAWIASQFDLFATLFMLLGVVANLTLKRARPLAVGACFFLAACCKESAAAFPLMIVVIDWALQSRESKGSVQPPRLSAFLKRNAATYATVFAFGLAYVGFRHWALAGGAVPSADSGQSLFGHLQATSSLYLRYWMMLFLPTPELGPLHPFHPEPFEVASPASIAIDVGAAALVAAALWQGLRRSAAWACIVLAMTATLLPVLRLIPSQFDGEFYHSRYLMTGLAVVCALLPLLRWRLPPALAATRTLRPAIALVALAWVASSVWTIRATIPMWSNSVSLWQWALEIDPTSSRAANALMIAYMDRDRLDEARRLGDWVMNQDMSCPNCFLNSAELALQAGDRASALAALRRADGVKDEILANWAFKQHYDDLVTRAALAPAM